MIPTITILLDTEESSYKFSMEMDDVETWEPLIVFHDVENNELIRIYPSEADQIVETLQRLKALANPTPKDM